MIRLRVMRPRGLPHKPKPMSVTPLSTWSSWFGADPNAELAGEIWQVTAPLALVSISLAQGAMKSVCNPCVAGR